MQEKKCNKCCEVKNVSEFYPKPKGKLGVTAVCKLCDSLIGKARFEKNKDKYLSNARERYVDRNKESYLEMRRKWAKDNKDRKNEQARARYKANPEKEKLRKKSTMIEWKKKNPGKVAEYSAKRKMAELNASIHIAGDAVLIENIYKESARLTRESGVQYEVDHIVPIQGKTVCGLHVSWNLRIITKTQNRSKGNSLNEDFNISGGKAAS